MDVRERVARALYGEWTRMSWPNGLGRLDSAVRRRWLTMADRAIQAIEDAKPASTQGAS